MERVKQEDHKIRKDQEDGSEKVIGALVEVHWHANAADKRAAIDALGQLANNVDTSSLLTH
jgi:hypothetical protein